MDPITMALLGGGAGLLKSELVDRPQEARDRQMQGEIARYSPWTHMQANTAAIHPANPFNSAIQGGATGLQMSQMQNMPWSQMGGDAAGSAGAIGAGTGGAPMSMPAYDPSNDSFLNSQMAQSPFKKYQ